MPALRRSELHELISLLFQVEEDGFVVIHRDRLLRLLGKGNEAAGTWAALLDAWAEVSDDASDLLRIRLPGGDRFLLTSQKLERKPVHTLT